MREFDRRRGLHLIVFSEPRKSPFASVAIEAEVDSARLRERRDPPGSTEEPVYAGLTRTIA